MATNIDQDTAAQRVQPRATAPARTAPATTPALLAPRWKKILADLWSNKTRTLLVVLSIFIGVFAVGMIASSQHILSNQLRESYLQTNPAHITVSTGAVGYNTDFTIDAAPTSNRGFDEDLVAAIEHMPEVARAEGRRMFNAQVRTGPDQWQAIQFMAIEDYAEMQVNQVEPVRGAWPPGDEEVLIERSSMSGPMSLNAEIGQSLLIELPDGKQRVMPITGVVHDMHQWPTPFLGTIYAYVNFDTLAWLHQPREFNQLHVVVAEHGDNQAHNERVAQEVYDKIRKAGLEPSFPQVPTPEEHPLEFLITALTAVMTVLSILAIFLSGFLVVNTIGALLMQQTRQIGVMKAIGARPRQLISMYLVLVVGFGLLALLPAIPLAHVATGVFTQAIADFLNFRVDTTQMPLRTILIQVGISLAVPVLAAIGPVISGTRVTVREALSSDSGPGAYGTGLIDRLMRRVQGLPRPILLSLRNTFRRKGRLLLTLTTLTLGGAIFIAVFSIRSSLLLTIENFTNSLYDFDVEIYLDRSYRAEYLARRAQEVPGVVAAESQVYTTARRTFADDREGLKLQFIAVPPETQTMQPNILEGRWLLPKDENALVVGTGVLRDDPDMRVGSTVTLKMDGRETEWEVVGLVPSIADVRWVYASYDYYGEVVRDVGQSSYVRIVGEQHDADSQLALANAVEQHYKDLGINVSSTKTTQELSQGDQATVEVIVTSLLFMAILVAMVGGLGLAGTMSLNVIERVREVGIMRSIGASDSSVLQIFIVEGIVIGVLSWSIGALFAIPISQLMSHGLGMMLLSMPLDFTFSVMGLLIWLAVSVVLAAVASYLPARNATRVSIREVLAHE